MPFAYAGSLRPAYEGMDWAAIGIGPPETWSTELDSALRLILSTRFPATLFWGRAGVLLHNEAYVPLIGDKHPAALGTPAAEVFPEIAGHPPPLLLAPDGTARLLEHRPELLLGVSPDTRRTDHTAVLPVGSTLLLYTDGLIERRHTGITRGIDWLVRVAGPLAGESLDVLCDQLLADTTGHAEDDIALLAVRAG